MNSQRSELGSPAADAIDCMDDGAQFDLGALLEVVNEHTAPVVEHRRARVA